MQDLISQWAISLQDLSRLPVYAAASCCLVNGIASQAMASLLAAGRNEGSLPPRCLLQVSLLWASPSCWVRAKLAVPPRENGRQSASLWQHPCLVRGPCIKEHTGVVAKVQENNIWTQLPSLGMIFSCGVRRLLLN